MLIIFKKNLIQRVWLGFFGTWALFLSGTFASVFQTPGVFQALELRALLSQRENELEMHLTDIQRVDMESERLEKNSYSIEQEIRKSLGYAAPDEIVFDFSEEEALGQLN